MTPGASAALVRRVAPSLVTGAAAERPITVDQTNHSVVVGETVVVKWLRSPAPPPHRGAQLLTHLAEVGFDEMPQFLGAPEVGGVVVAVLTRYVPGTIDGWEWYVDRLTGDLVAGDYAASIEAAERIGALAARLHRSLATPSSVLREPVRRAPADGECRRGLALLVEALRATPDAAGVRLAARADRIADDIGRLGTVGEIAVQPIHGDLHVGQLLRGGDGCVVVTDFDGDPVTPHDVAADGVERRTAMVDLASLVQSVDHVARVVAKRRFDLTARLDEFLDAATARLIDAYAATAVVEHGLLRPLRVIQELHELVYASQVLPGWRYAPDAALAALYP